ncbi:hypothetical protein P8452_50340 [Trifolium repens]|nr:hypothetical protein P8452_50340 [Trifolium repens]
MSSMGQQQLDENCNGALKLVSIPDGLSHEEDRTNFAKLCEAILSTMPTMLENLLKDICLNDNCKISCIVADVNMGWALNVGSKFGINGALFWSSSAAMFAMVNNIPKLIDDGIIDSDGLSSTRKTFQLSPNMPMMDTEALLSLVKCSCRLTKP